jgi:anionic cell wall polymer biosynthesis LytR-Cps2A-Psr (LCP) family protein
MVGVVLGSGVTSSVLAKVGYSAACLAAMVVIVVAGYAHNVVSAANLIEGGASIGSGPSVGAMNILLMGLESRTDFDGNTLSSAQLTQTHSGSNGPDGNLGAQDTDTLILIHVFAGGQKAIGYSIPRDDVVNYPHTSDGVTEGKIDGAYNYAYTQYVSENLGKMGHDALYQGANQAGQVFQVQTVESVTGVHIDHFVVSNIYGFELIAQELGGIEVCLQPAPHSIEPDDFPTGGNLVDLPYPGANFKLLSNSGFNAPKYDGYNLKKGGAQYLHLSPPQALAFVRARDSLPGVDIGRTHRQQAAIDYIIYDLKNRSVLTDPSVISSLLNGASSYLKTDSGFSLLDFAPEMKSLTGSNLSLATLPDAAVNNIYIPAFGNHLQDANYIYVPDIQRMVNAGFYGSAAVKPAKSVTVDVYNGSGAGGLAGDASQAFVSQGYTAGKADNATAQSQPVQADSQVFYGAGAGADAASIADEVGAITAGGALGATALPSLPAGHVEVLLGSTVTALPAGLETYGGSTVTAQDFSVAAQQDNLPASEQPPASATASGTAGTQSVSSSLSGARAQAPAAAATKPAAKPSASSGSAIGNDSAVPAGARFGIPCVY